MDIKSQLGKVTSLNDKFNELANKSIYDLKGKASEQIGKLTPNDPTNVMAKNELSGPKVLQMNRELTHNIRFTFYEYDKTTVYNIKNDTGVDAASTLKGFSNTAGATASDKLSAMAGDAKSKLDLVVAKGADGVKTVSGAIGKKDNGFVSMLKKANAEHNSITQAKVEKTLKNPLALIELPMPQNLLEQFNIDFQNEGIGLINKTLMDMFPSVNISKMNAEDILKFGGEAASRVTTATVSATTETLPISAAVDTVRGRVKNPFYAVLFRGVPLRQHEFTWRLVPESPAEADDLDAIIDELRKRSLPQFEKEGELNLIMYPDFCMVELTPRVYEFPKPCFVSSIKFDKSPDGLPAFYKDDRAVGVQITMSLLETTAVTREDYTAHETQRD